MSLKQFTASVLGTTPQTCAEISNSNGGRATKVMGANARSFSQLPQQERLKIQMMTKSAQALKQVLGFVSNGQRSTVCEDRKGSIYHFTDAKHSRHSPD